MKVILNVEEAKSSWMRCCLSPPRVMHRIDIGLTFIAINYKSWKWCSKCNHNIYPFIIIIIIIIVYAATIYYLDYNYVRFDIFDPKFFCILDTAISVSNNYSNVLCKVVVELRWIRYHQYLQ